MQLLVDHRGMERYLFHVLAKEEASAFAGGNLAALTLSLVLALSRCGAGSCASALR